VKTFKKGELRACRYIWGQRKKYTKRAREKLRLVSRAF
jgi:hypothetical protein